MFSRTLGVAIALAGMAAASPAAAQANPDVRCFILANTFAQQGGTPQAKSAGQLSAFYYLGRINGRMSDAQLRAAITAETATLKPATAGAEMATCAKRVQAAGAKIQTFAPTPKKP